MYIDIVPNRGSPPAILLRESIREGKRVRKPTIANLSALPVEQAEMIRRVLKGEKLGPLESALDRGMISQVQIDAIAKLDGVDWITALKSGGDPQAGRRRRLSATREQG
jgi:hypothetical protein